MSREALLGYVILFVGVVVGWALCWLWGSVRERRREISEIMFQVVKDGETTFGELANTLLPPSWQKRKAESIDAECADGKFRIVEEK